MLIRFSWPVLVVVLGLLFMPTLSAQEQTKAIDALFEAWTTPTSPGAAIAIMREGEVVYRKGFGSANLEYDLPITPTTVFHAASLSKQFTAFAILQLAEAGQLSLTDDVHKYLPELQDYGEVITIRHLLTHTSGMRDQWRLLALAGWAREDVVRNREILDLAARQRGLNFSPGDRFMYSNLGYTLLAEIVSRVSGQSFASYTREHIFVPLEMEDSQFYDDYHQIVKHRAYSYGQKAGETVKRPLNLSTVGATSLFTTVDDLLKWAQNFTSLRIGSPSIMEEMKQGAKLNSGAVLDVLAGQFHGTYLGRDVYLHSGSDAGFRSYLLRFPAEGISVALLANTSTADVETLAFSAASHFLPSVKADAQSGTGAAKKGDYPHPENIFIELPISDLQAFVGKYWEHNNWYDREIRLTEEGLSYYRPGSGKATKLRPVGPNSFKMIDDTEDVTVTFKKNGHGLATMLVRVNDEPEIEHLAYDNFALSGYTGDYYSEELAVTYSVRVKQDQLVLYTLRTGEIALKSVARDYFTCSDRNYKKVQFRRDEQGNLTGFSVANGGITRLDFTLLREPIRP